MHIFSVKKIYLLFAVPNYPFWYFLLFDIKGA